MREAAAEAAAVMGWVAVAAAGSEVDCISG